MSEAMNSDQRITIKGVLGKHGLTGLAFMSAKELVRFYGICRGTPVAVLFRPRSEVMPRRMIPTAYKGNQ